MKTPKHLCHLCLECCWMLVESISFVVCHLAASIEIAVYFMDKTGLSLQVENGQNMHAGELFERIMTELDYPPQAREVFSLWLVSDLLGEEWS